MIKVVVPNTTSQYQTHKNQWQTCTRKQLCQWTTTFHTLVSATALSASFSYQLTL